MTYKSNVLRFIEWTFCHNFFTGRKLRLFVIFIDLHVLHKLISLKSHNCFAKSRFLPNNLDMPTLDTFLAEVRIETVNNSAG